MPSLSPLFQPVILYSFTHNSITEHELYPNPVKHELVFSFSSSTCNEDGNWLINDLSGRVVMLGNLEDNCRHVVLVQSLPSGSYVLAVKAKGKLYTKQFLKME